ncbi:hypothetical protein AgCh_000030 [Apium graveolens]
MEFDEYDYLENKASSVRNESNAGLRKTRSEAGKDSNMPGSGSEGISSQLIIFESNSDKIVGDSSRILSADEIRRMSIESEGSQSETSEHFDQTKKVLDVSVVAIKKSPAGIAKSNCKELIEYEEKTITSNLVPVADGYCSVPKRHSKLQSLVDLVMWRDASRPAFIFGLGTSVIMSSSYTTDLDISLITVLSYVGLIYLAVTFLFRSLRHRDYLL